MQMQVLTQVARFHSSQYYCATPSNQPDRENWEHTKAPLVDDLWAHAHPDRYSFQLVIIPRTIDM